MGQAHKPATQRTNLRGLSVLSRPLWACIHCMCIIGKGLGCLHWLAHAAGHGDNTAHRFLFSQDCSYEEPQLKKLAIVFTLEMVVLCSCCKTIFTHGWAAFWAHYTYTRNLRSQFFREPISVCSYSFGAGTNFLVVLLQFSTWVLFFQDLQFLRARFVMSVAYCLNKETFAATLCVNRPSW